MAQVSLLLTLIVMFRYRELKDYEKAVQTSVSVFQTFTTSPGVLKTVNLKYMTGEYLRLYHRFLDTVPGYGTETLDDGRVVTRNDLSFKSSTGVWKPCQSYKGYMVDDTPFDSAGIIPWVSGSPTSLGVYVPVTGGVDRKVVATYRRFTDRFGAFGQHYAGLPSMTETVLGSLSFVPKPTGLSNLVEASLKNMLPHIKAELSLINSIIELKDFKSLPHTLSNLKGTISRLSKFVKNGRQALGRNPFSLIRKSFNPDQGLTLRELLHSTADGYLQAEFNLLPLFSDVCAVFRAFAGLSKKMNNLVQNQGRLRTKHYSFPFIPAQFTGADAEVTYSLDLDQFTGTENNGTGKIGCYRAYGHQLHVKRQVLVDEPAIFHAEVEFNYHLSQYQLEHAQVLTLLDLLGVNLSPAIIWNAIPWSFVVDWFVGVSRYLADRKVINMEPAINITRYMWSWRCTRKIKCYFEEVAGQTQKPLCPRTYLPTLYETIYRRDVDLPAYTNSLYGSGLSGTELSLGAALVTTRAWHPRRGRR